METLKSKRRWRWGLLIGGVLTACFLYWAVPRAIWLWRVLGDLEAATAEASKLIGEPAADWTTADLEGAPHSLADYRGKVVVLDFWYAGCGWCLRSMPQMVELAEEFEGQPVVVLGINWDEDVSDARRAIEYFDIPYATLRAEGDGQPLYDTYKIIKWPSVIVLDQEGVVRHVHCGYWPTMRRSLAKKVRELLEEKEG